MTIPGIETVPYREPAGPIPLVFTQHVCEHEWSKPQNDYAGERVGMRCKKCKKMVIADADLDGHPVVGTGRDVWADDTGMGDG
jgi:hypothetical protein